LLHQHFQLVELDVTGVGAEYGPDTNQ
jgi:hypothetical protein